MFAFAYAQSIVIDIYSRGGICFFFLPAVSLYSSSAHRKWLSTATSLTTRTVVGHVSFRCLPLCANAIMLRVRVELPDIRNMPARTAYNTISFRIRLIRVMD